jgi:hypothetical protein
MRQSREYQIYNAIATYLKYQYPKILYHFDPTGLNLSKAQSGMLKAIQCNKGYPDLVILESRGQYKSFFLEIKSEGTNLYKKSGESASEHIADQLDCLLELRMRGYKAEFAVGFSESKELIDDYLKSKL